MNAPAPIRAAVLLPGTCGAFLTSMGLKRKEL